MIRTIVYYGNNFQWKINVAVRTIPHLLSSALLCRLLRLPSALLCFCYLLFCSASAFFFSLFISSNVPAALPSAGSGLILSTLPSFRLLCSSCSALPALLCSSCSALLDGGGLTLSQKKGRSHSSLQKFPPFFQKSIPPSLYLTPHILRTVAHLAPTTLIFNTTLTHI